MLRRTLQISFVAGALLAISGVAKAGSVIAMGQDQSTFGLPAKLSSLSDLHSLASRSDLLAAQKTEVLLKWLKEEQRNPSPTTIGLGGGPIDTAYIQVQMSQAIAGAADVRAVRWLLASPGLKSHSVRVALRMSLAVAGDSEQLGFLLDTVRSNPNPYYRELAARVLPRWDDPRVKPALEEARNDPFSLTTEGGFESPPGTIFPVRRSAKEGLDNIARGVEPDSDFSRKRKASFEARLRGMQEFVRQNKATLDRLLLIGNSGA